MTANHAPIARETSRRNCPRCPENGQLLRRRFRQSDMGFEPRPLAPPDCGGSRRRPGKLKPTRLRGELRSLVTGALRQREWDRHILLNRVEMGQNCPRRVSNRCGATFIRARLVTSTFGGDRSVRCDSYDLAAARPRIRLLGRRHRCRLGSRRGVQRDSRQRAAADCCAQRNFHDAHVGGTLWDLSMA